MSRRLLAMCVLVCVFACSAFAYPLVVGTFNAESGDAEPAVVSEMLVSTDPLCDVWGLTEVQNAGWAGVFEQKMESVTDDNYSVELGTTGGPDKLAVLYNDDRFDLVARRELHKLKEGRGRSPLVVTLKHTTSTDTTNDRFVVIVCHLYRTDRYKRWKQSYKLNRWIRDLELPVIVLGDFNYDWDVENGDDKHGGGYDLLTADGVLSWVRPKQLIRTQCNPRYNAVLDFVFVANGAKRWQGVSKIVKTDCVDTAETSDHRPVVAVFDVGTKRR